ncbi:hypothetical protein QF012_005728 [Pseudomonas laurylsulfatiphila]
MRWFFHDSDDVFVGASLLAMVVNDNACDLDKRGALESIASRLAPTVSPCGRGLLWELACRVAASQRWSLTITRVNLHKRGALESIASKPAPTVSPWARSPVGAGLPAMVVNDDACERDERGALESIASRLAPTVSAWARSFVGAGLPAMVVNDNACDLDKRGALESIASRLAPTVSPCGRGLLWELACRVAAS